MPLLLAGCSGDNGTGDKPPAPAATASDNTSTGASAEGSQETNAVRFAAAAWAAFFGNANAGQGYDQWWSTLRPLLTPAAVEVHVYDDPRTFPKVKITGELSEAPTAPDVPGVTAEVYVPSDLGRFSLFLSRTDESAPWRLEHIGFPKGAQ